MKAVAVGTFNIHLAQNGSMTVNVAQDTVGGEKKWVVSKGTSGFGRPETFDTKSAAVKHARRIADKGERITAGTTVGGKEVIREGDNGGGNSGGGLFGL